MAQGWNETPFYRGGERHNDDIDAEVARQIATPPVTPSLLARANDIGESVDHLEKQLAELGEVIRRLGDRRSDNVPRETKPDVDRAARTSPGHLAYALEGQCRRLQSANYALENLLADLSALI